MKLIPADETDNKGLYKDIQVMGIDIDALKPKISVTADADHFFELAMRVDGKAKQLCKICL